MRTVATIPHPTITIRVFQMNEKYVVNFEAGPMEQAFKFSFQEVKSLENLLTIINADFIEKVRGRFNEMYLQLKETIRT